MLRPEEVNSALERSYFDAVRLCRRLALLEDPGFRMGVLDPRNSSAKTRDQLVDYPVRGFRETNGSESRELFLFSRFQNCASWCPQHQCSFDAKAARIIFRATESEDWISLSPKPGYNLRGTNPDSVKGWKERFFFLQEPSDCELPRAWGPISEYFRDKPTDEHLAESSKLLSTIKSVEKRFSIQGYFLTSVTFEIGRWGPPAGWAIAGPGPETSHGPSIKGSPAQERLRQPRSPGEIAAPSPTSTAELAAAKSREVESLLAGIHPPAAPARQRMTSSYWRAQRGHLLGRASSRRRGPGSRGSPTILVEPISVCRPPEDLAALSEVGTAPAADPAQADEGEARQVGTALGRDDSTGEGAAGTSSRQEPPSAPTAASLPASPPQAVEEAEPQGEALPGNFTPFLRVASLPVPGDAVPFEVLADSFRGDLERAIISGHQLVHGGLAQIASLTGEIGQLRRRVEQLEGLFSAAEERIARLVGDVVGRHSPSEWQLAMDTRYWDGIRLCHRIVSLAAPHVPAGVLHPGNAGVGEASCLKTFPEVAGPSSLPD
ncbi:hypothetical protein Nepgr_003665 [Nepenthes gracilis]|uniref:Uncharacterized protein n=1 Tax=Nepenthes gracilis TaxID=150966 RepID=A0AAD3RZX9_NEPGR|nr:hypothetical protein Nepgr_003665 [Nepenthes gracilis]